MLMTLLKYGSLISSMIGNENMTQRLPGERVFPEKLQEKAGFVRKRRVTWLSSSNFTRRWTQAPVTGGIRRTIAVSARSERISWQPFFFCVKNARTQKENNQRPRLQLPKAFDFHRACREKAGNFYPNEKIICIKHSCVFESLVS